MIILGEKFIKNYINKLTINDINNFLLKENISINSNDINIIYIYIKNNFDEILKDEIKVLNRVKNDVNKDTYDKILYLYDKYKDKIILFKKMNNLN